MYIISFDEEQFVIVEVEGNLEELISITHLINPAFKFYMN